ncbi:unnamed protein product [Vicia faba]|uniref:mitogen-activated protein kinase kinase kinase n=1 Tax=Vicia faba TaxID=3906 RepID=A0AAV0ZIS5_VICFA|nr:unnamed protein product [Vicia faba]
MDSKKLRSKPKLDRRNALKYFDYDAGSSSSSSDDSSGSLYTRSMELYDRTSFRIEGVEGELDRICKSLGLSGPEDFSIPAAAWEAMKVRYSSDSLPSLKLGEVDFREKVDEVRELEEEGGLNKKCEDSVMDRDRVTDEVVQTVVVAASSGGTSGIHPPLIKVPELAPVREGEVVEKEGEEVGIGRGSLKREEEDGVVDNSDEMAEIVVGLSESSMFSTSNEDDSSRTAVEPRSNDVCRNGRIQRIITPGCWQKGQFLGGGSFGYVFEGISDDGFFFAVKEVSLLDQGDQGKQSVYQLEQEIALLSRFEHDNIVQYYGTEMDESKLHIFIELVTKGSLRSLYQRYTLRDSQVSAYTRQILHGLKYLHNQNVVHRDIKCANILVHASGSVKLADFGLAKATKLNDVKSCKGTAFWMAPEVVKGKNKGYGLPADVWSLGCTVLEMLTGQIPYSNLECMQAIFRIGKGVLPPIPDTLSRDAKDFIMQCLQVNPDDRPTAAQLLNHPFLQRPLSQPSSPYIHGKRG